MKINPTIEGRKARMEHELAKLEARHISGAYRGCEDVYEQCHSAIVACLADIEFDRLAELAK